MLIGEVFGRTTLFAAGGTLGVLTTETPATVTLSDFVFGGEVVRLEALGEGEYGLVDNEVRDGVVGVGDGETHRTALLLEISRQGIWVGDPVGRVDEGKVLEAGVVGDEFVFEFLLGPESVAGGHVDDGIVFCVGAAAGDVLDDDSCPRSVLFKNYSFDTMVNLLKDGFLVFFYF